MSKLRFDALKASMSRKPVKVNENSRRSTIYGSNVFSLPLMQTFLPNSTFKKLLISIEKNQTISRDIADQIAVAMKDWSISKGVTQYKLISSLGATETYPFIGSSEIITDITSTGKTLEDNNLRILKDGLILKSAACLLFPNKLLRGFEH